MMRYLQDFCQDDSLEHETCIQLKFVLPETEHPITVKGSILKTRSEHICRHDDKYLYTEIYIRFQRQRLKS